MIKFEFTLNDQDASNLIDILHNEKVRTLATAQNFIKKDMNAVDQANLDWYNGHAAYLQSLKEKVLAGNKPAVDERKETVLLDLSDADFLAIAKMAHEKDITFNEMISEILKNVIAKWNI